MQAGSRIAVHELVHEFAEIPPDPAARDRARADETGVESTILPNRESRIESRKHSAKGKFARNVSELSNMRKTPAVDGTWDGT
jgi:hypothetical protein